MTVASRDYVRRSGGPKNKRRPAAPQKVSKPLPIRSGLLAIVVVSVFVYGLTFLSQNPAPSAVNVAKPEPAPVVVTKPTKQPDSPTKDNDLPPPPEQQWDYQQILPNSEIEVTGKELAVSRIPYVMQCGAYKLAEQAEERKAMIAFEGLSSQISKKENSSWYRVILGPYKFKRDAERDKHKLERAKIEPCAIWKESQ